MGYLILYVGDETTMEWAVLKEETKDIFIIAGRFDTEEEANKFVEGETNDKD